MRLALVGDVHGQWDRADSAWFDRSSYDAVLFTGDLPGRGHVGLREVAAAIGALRKPAVLIPGNHDGPTPVDVLREALWTGVTAAGGRRMAEVMDEVNAALGPVVVGGYSRHRLGVGEGAIDLLVARPHAMDGRKLTFAPFLAERFGVHDLEESTARLCALVDTAERPVVFLCHNGPAGFGAGRADPWGLPMFGRDNGDPDLAEAIAYARASGKQVLAVVTGHMHWNRRHARDWQVRRDGVLYVNAARVPRWSRGVARHVALELGPREATARLVEVER